ncbi:MAG: cytochrome P450 [Dehalococcoidia bacterium]
MMNSPASEATDYLPWGNPDFLRNPYPWFDRLRKEKPVYRTAEGVYVVTRYEDILNYGRSPSITILNPHATAFYDGFAHTMLGQEPPEHTITRARTVKWLTQPLCEEWTRAGVEVIHSTLDAYREGEVIDGHHRLGMLPAHAAICKLLQVPARDPEPAIAAMLDVMRSASAIATDADHAAAAKGFAYLQTRVAELLEYKKAHPGDGLADALIGLAEKGEISDDELRQTMSLFWGSGAHNPSYLIAAALEFFASRPDVYDLFRSNAEKRKGIINELTRLFPAELSMTRYATEDFEIRGTTIPKGAQIRFLLNSANRDPEVFPNPDEFDASRPTRPMNLTFGVGHHGCAGTTIARTEADMFLGAIARRVKRIHMAGESTFDRTDRASAYLTQYLRLEMA